MTAPLPAYWYGDKTLCADCARDVVYGLDRLQRRTVEPGMWNCDYCGDVIGSALARVAERVDADTNGGGA